MLAHEQAHLRRLDNLWKLAGYLLVCVYWFHPLVWVAYSLFCRDIELACDESVIKEYDAHGRRMYSEALLADWMEKVELPAATARCLAARHPAAMMGCPAEIARQKGAPLRWIRWIWQGRTGLCGAAVYRTAVIGHPESFVGGDVIQIGQRLGGGHISPSMRRAVR